MNIIQILTDAVQLFKKLLNDLSGKRSLVYLLTLAIAVSLGAGFILYTIDPSVHSLTDGIWSAWVTMTHVGFGDVVPTSLLGRLFSAGLILFGLALFSLCTAILSASLIGKNIDTWGDNVRHIEQETNRIEADEDKILSELARLHERMERLETALKEKS
ncbi:MAG: two pore domain potassium channel family protein [Methylococcales bacterium]|nr:two pore domain potassium channel family protein [Methylococcales bacterium]